MKGVANDSSVLAVRAPRTGWNGKRYDTGRWTQRSVGVQFATEEEQINSSRNNEETDPKQKRYPTVDVSGGESKVQCCKEQHCIGTWNVWSMNQGIGCGRAGKARLKIKILGIRELKWTGLGEFNSDNHYITPVGKKSLSRNGVTPHSQQKNPKYSTWVQPQNNRMILVHFQGRPFNITVNQVYAPTTDAEATEVDWFYEDLEHLLELTPK